MTQKTLEEQTAEVLALGTAYEKVHAAYLEDDDTEEITYQRAQYAFFRKAPHMSDLLRQWQERCESQIKPVIANHESVLRMERQKQKMLTDENTALQQRVAMLEQHNEKLGDFNSEMAIKIEHLEDANKALQQRVERMREAFQEFVNEVGYQGWSLPTSGDHDAWKKAMEALADEAVTQEK